MEFFRRAAGRPALLGVLPGTFNPPTVAHLALARAALAEVDEVLFVLPRVFPHKRYEGARFEDRVRMLEAATAGEPRFSAGSSDHGLFIDIARECLEAYGRGTALAFLCGRDAAERIVNWDYGRPDAFREMLDVFELRVAARQGGYQAPAALSGRIRALKMDCPLDDISATSVRERMARGEPWEYLVPPGVAPLARQAYGLR